MINYVVNKKEANRLGLAEHAVVSLKGLYYRNKFAFGDTKTLKAQEVYYDGILLTRHVSIKEDRVVGRLPSGIPFFSLSDILKMQKDGIW